MNKQRSLLVWLHGWEKKNLLDAVRITHEHGKTIDTESPTTSRGKTVFKRLNEVSVDTLGFEISLILSLGLVKEEVNLDLRIVKLCVGVDKFVIVAEELESLDEAGLSSVPLGKRTHDLGMIDQESGVLAIDLNEVTNKLVDKSGGGAGIGTIDTLFLCNLFEEKTCLLGGKSLTLRKLNSENIFKSLHHWDSLEGRSKVNLDCVELVLWPIGVILNLERSVNLHDHLGNHVLSKLHHIVVISISLIELASSKLRVMSEIDALVSELLSDFEYSVNSSNNKLLEVQLWSDSHE